MTQTCDILHTDGFVHDTSGCYLPDGHKGPHEFKDQNGNVWCWETDFECNCEHCVQCQGDYCNIYWRKEKEC